MYFYKFIQHPSVSTIVAQVANSLTTFAFAYSLMQFSTSLEFGQYCGLQLVFCLGMVFQTALVQSPVMLLYAKYKNAYYFIEHGVLKLGFWIAPFFLFVTIIYGLAQGLHPTSLLLAPVFICLQLRRFLQRFCLQQEQCFFSISLVDFKSSICSIFLIIIGVIGDSISLDYVLFVQVLSLIVWRYPTKNLRKWRVTSKDIQDCRISYKMQGKSALKGAFTSEVMANGHAYCIAFFLGSLSFAPFAAAALALRPASVIAYGLIQAARPKICTLIQDCSDSSINDIRNIIKKLNFGIFIFFLANVLFLVILIELYPKILWPHGATNEFLWALLLTVAMSAFRLKRSVQTLVFQAQNNFDLLWDVQKYPSIVGLFLSIALISINQYYSMGAMVLAELVLFFLIHRKFRQVNSHFFR